MAWPLSWWKSTQKVHYVSNVAFWDKRGVSCLAFVLTEAKAAAKKNKEKKNTIQNIFNSVVKQHYKHMFIILSLFLRTTTFIRDSLYCSNNYLCEFIGNKSGMKVFRTCKLLLVRKRSRHTHLKEHNIRNAQFVLTFLPIALSLAFWNHSVRRRAIKWLNGCKHTCSC